MNVRIRLVGGHDRARYRQELLRYTDLELIWDGSGLRRLIANRRTIVFTGYGDKPRFDVQIADVIEHSVSGVHSAGAL